MKILVYGVDGEDYNKLCESFAKNPKIELITVGSNKECTISYTEIEKGREKYNYNSIYNFSKLDGLFIDFWHSIDRNSSCGVRYTLVRQLFKEYITSWEDIYSKYKWDRVIFLTVPHLQWCVSLQSFLHLMQMKSYALSPTVINEYRFLIDLPSHNVVKHEYKNEKNWNYKYKSLVSEVSRRDYKYIRKQKVNYLKSLRYTLFLNIPTGISVFIASVYEKLSGKPLFKFKSVISYRFSWSGMHLKSNKNFLHELKEKLQRIHILKKEYYKASKKINFEDVGDFVYMPLHYQPEATTYPISRNHSDQIDFAHRLADQLGEINVRLIIKEHPSTFSVFMRGDRGRNPNYYKILLRHNNILIASMNADSNLLLSKALSVVTINGTASAEKANTLGIGISFFPSWASIFSNYHKCSEIDDVIKIVSNKGFENESNNVRFNSAPYIFDITNNTDCYDIVKLIST